MAFRLSLTGRPDLTDDDGRSIRLPRKAFVLAAHLVLDHAKTSLPRDVAARLLWEEVDPARRSGNLRQLVARTKEVQAREGFELFVVDAERIALDPEVAEIDVNTVLAARADTTDARLVELCRAYGGDLLAGLDEGGAEFTRWLWARRATLRDRFVSVVAANLEATVGILEADEIIFAARRLIDADHYQETAYRTLMRVHAARGEYDSAFRVHRRLVDALRETEGRPSGATAALIAEINERMRAVRGAISGDPSPASAEENFAPAAPSVGGSARLPRLSLTFPGLAELVGAERAWAEALFDDAAIHLWRTRAFVLTRDVDLRVRPIDLVERARREPSDYILECRMAERDGRRHLTFGLVGAATGEILWIHRFDVGEPLDGALRAVVTNCVHHVEQAELRVLAADPERATAHRLTVQGHRLLRSIDLPTIRRARQIFRNALAMDPENAATLAAISKAYRLEWLRLARADDKELDLAIDFARQAINIGPEAAHGLHQLGICNIYKKRHDAGLDALARAERIMPFDAELVADHADGLICSGSIEEGLEKFTALAEDPFQLGDPILWNLASGQYLAGRYEEALEILSRLTSQEPTYQLRAACHAMLSQTGEAQRYVRRLREILPDFSIASRLGMVPLRRREDFEHYESGLRSAGID